MNKTLEKTLQAFSRPYLTDAELEMLIEGTPDSRYGKVKRLLAQGKLLHIRRGLYSLTSEVGYLNIPNTFELSQYIYGPSYISLESALSYHQLIPEAVYTVTSATSKRSKEYQTPLGHFSYLHLPLKNFYTEVELIKENDYHFFMAKPWKALCDYLFCNKIICDNLEPFLESLRISYENLPKLRIEEIQLLDEYYHHKRISLFLKNISRDLIL